MLIRWYILKVIKINTFINNEEKGSRNDRIIRLDCACDAKNGYALRDEAGVSHSDNVLYASLGRNNIEN